MSAVDRVGAFSSQVGKTNSTRRDWLRSLQPASPQAESCRLEAVSTSSPSPSLWTWPDASTSGGGPTSLHSQAGERTR